MGINIFLFVYYYLFYDQGPQFEYTRELLGVSYDIKNMLAFCKALSKTKEDTKEGDALFYDIQS